MRLQVMVRLKPSVLDVQGKAVERSLHGMGVEGIDNIRIGRLIELDIEADDYAAAQAKAEELCQRLLANTVIENYEIRLP